jgi:hypothetical protein
MLESKGPPANSDVQWSFGFDVCFPKARQGNEQYQIRSIRTFPVEKETSLPGIAVRRTASLCSPMTRQSIISEEDGCADQVRA